ncbi:MAG TPA: hypothetical protein VGA36_07985 [Nitriliruptorales bacterium]
MSRRFDRRFVADLSFWIVFGIFAGGALLILAQGLLAVVASADPDLHETLHSWGITPPVWPRLAGVVGRVAMRVADASHDVPGAGQVALDYAFSAVHLAMAGVLLWLRPRDWTARVLAVALVGAAGVFNLTSQAVLEELPLTTPESLAQAGAHVTAGLAYVYALLLFPDGRPVPRWRPRALAWLYLPGTFAAIVLSARVEGSARPAVLLLVFGLLVPAVGAAAQAYRIRRAVGDVTGQAQARLLFWALLPSVAIGLAYVALNGWSPTTTALAGRGLSDPPVTLYRGFQPAFALIPVALFAGILRFRLWDIERLFSRTIVYAAATSLLGGVYWTFVVVSQQALGQVAASPLIDSKLAVAVTTLAVASFFRPVRDRVQRFVDRRFNRSRYDAQVMIEQFVSGLRDQVELESITASLEDTLVRVIQPRHVSMWLCSPTHPDRMVGRSAAHIR